MRSKIAAILIVVAIISTQWLSNSTFAQQSQQSGGITVTLDGEQIEFEHDPIVQSGTTMIQFVPIFRELGLQFDWDQGSKTVTGYKDDWKIELTVGESTAYINGKAVELAQAPILHNNTTFVPLRFIGEASGKTVIWHGEEQRAELVTSLAQMLYDTITQDTLHFEWNMHQTSLNESAEYLETKDSRMYFGIETELGFLLKIYRFNGQDIELIHYLVSDDQFVQSDFTQTREELISIFTDAYGSPETDENGIFWMGPGNYKSIAGNEESISITFGPELFKTPSVIEHVEKLFVTDEEADFRNVKWGMSQEDVKANEEHAVLLLDNGDELLYQINVDQQQFILKYTFKEGLLVEGNYIFSDLTNDHVPLMDAYNQFHDLLVEQYGESTSNSAIWTNEEYKQQPDKWELAVQNGDMSMLSNWETPTSSILLALHGTDDAVGVWVTYQEQE